MEQAENLYFSSCIINSVLNSVSSFTAILLNVLTIHAMRKTTELPNTLKTLLLSLAVSDLCVGLLVQPLFVVELVNCNTEEDFHKPNALTLIFSSLCNIFSYASFLGVTALSIDRYLAVHLHLRYQELVTPQRVFAVVIIVWILSALLSFAEFLPLQIAETITVAVVLGCCFICTTLVYCKIYATVRRHTNQILDLQLRQLEQGGEMVVNAAKQRKSAISAFYVYLVFLFCYLPCYCVFIVGSFIPEPKITFVDFELYASTLLFLNSSVNPVIYCWKMRHIRRSIICILRNIFCVTTE